MTTQRITPTSAHTPTPWLVSARAYFRIITEWGATVATVGSDSDLRDQWEANAAFIVDAVNNYASQASELERAQKRVKELEGALRPLVEFYDHFWTTDKDQAAAYYSMIKGAAKDKAWAAARAALAAGTPNTTTIAALEAADRGDLDDDVAAISSTDREGGK